MKNNGLMLKAAEMRDEPASSNVNKHALHGGDIIGASQKYNIAIENWIDLSTGLNPDSYPINDVPESVFQHLPYLQPSFMSAAASYYGSDQSIPLIGSQMLIQTLPQCVAKHPVLLPDLGYSEHRDSWLKAGFDLTNYPAKDHETSVAVINAALAQNPKQHLVVINPNNPSGLLIAPEQLVEWASQLTKGCCLIVDEAFIDMTPQWSVLSHHWPSNMLVLRSFGKFFGLAGIRIGFAFCQGKLREKIEQKLGLWMINGPAQYIATKAMLDSQWQQQVRLKIALAAKKTQQLCLPLLAKVETLKAKDEKALKDKSRVTAPVTEVTFWHTHQDLFSSYQMPLSLALAIQEHFAKAGILLRVIRFEDESQVFALLRIGILGLEDSQAHQRITQCIQLFCEK